MPHRPKGGKPQRWETIGGPRRKRRDRANMKPGADQQDAPTQEVDKCGGRRIPRGPREGSRPSAARRKKRKQKHNEAPYDDPDGGTGAIGIGKRDHKPSNKRPPRRAKMQVDSCGHPSHPTLQPIAELSKTGAKEARTRHYGHSGPLSNEAIIIAAGGRQARQPSKKCMTKVRGRVAAEG